MTCLKYVCASYNELLLIMIPYSQIKFQLYLFLNQSLYWAAEYFQRNFIRNSYSIQNNAESLLIHIK
jgi:hypothetical protein